jgi:hypothetical protein
MRTEFKLELGGGFTALTVKNIALRMPMGSRYE